MRPGTVRVKRDLGSPRRTWMNCLDFVVAGFCVVEVFWLLSAGSSGVNFDFFRLLRVVKLTKALRMCLGQMQPACLFPCLNFRMREEERQRERERERQRAREGSRYPLVAQCFFSCKPATNCVLGHRTSISLRTRPGDGFAQGISTVVLRWASSFVAFAQRLWRPGRARSRREGLSALPLAVWKVVLIELASTIWP